MGYCTPNDPTEEPLYSWIVCPNCDGDGWIENEDGDIEKCCRCDGEGEIVFEQE